MWIFKTVSYKTSFQVETIQTVHTIRMQILKAIVWTRINSIKVSKPKLRIATSIFYNKTAKKSNQKRLLSQERRDSEYFQISICICAAFLSQAYKNGSKGLEETLIDRVANGSDILILLARPSNGSQIFIAIFMIEHLRQGQVVLLFFATDVSIFVELRSCGVSIDLHGALQVAISNCFL